ncbi:predicted protein [Uncinocarpus reesii 1704]|uniref:SsDNA binding protein n=1 Tax=Uncinocarpus reesii (strain UAMH 1704) TaxID=336963 RepID=C4JN21_UNCRE|nr:uncharacterized protein UREG_04229 [Uncinocarpus reesii 1704]EEP79383.1 predicted protein [Uncinocarpus reesii 1704]
MFGLTRFAPALRTASVPRAFTTTSARGIATITITGRLGAAPELKTSQNGREYVRYVLASTSGPNRDASWFRINSFAVDKARDHLLGLPKGTLMSVTGDATVNAVENADGQRSFNLNVTQRNYEVLLRGKPEAEASQGSE